MTRQSNFVSSANKKELNFIDALVISLIYNKKVKARAQTLKEHRRECTLLTYTVIYICHVSSLWEIRFKPAICYIPLIP